MTKECESFSLDINSNGVFLGMSGESDRQVMDKDGQLTTFGRDQSSNIQTAARESLEDWKRRFPHKLSEALYPGWSYVVDHNGKGHAKSCGHTKVFLEREFNNHNTHEVRVRIDSGQNSKSKSAPLEVILRLVGKEAQRHMKIPE